MIGYNRRVDYEWLRYTAELLGQGETAAGIYDALSALLSHQLSVGSTAQRGSREKTITLLIKTWVNVPKELRAFRDEGLQLLQESPVKQQIAVHWGMSTAVYPFWGVVAETTGRLLKLQDRVSAAQVQKRVKEKYGQRETAARSARYVLRAFVNWGILEETSQQGLYRQGLTCAIDNPRLIGWLTEAILHMSEKDAFVFRDALESPVLFPFIIQSSVSDYLNDSKRLELIRHGLDEDLVRLSRTSEF
jgi:hypothetical protein